MFRRIAGLVALCMGLVTASYVWSPGTADAAVGGPIILMGIDAEDGGVGGHGPISVYQSVTASMLADTSKGSGILVLGGGKSAGDNVTTFWNTIASGVGQSVSYANGAAVGTVSLTPYRLVVVVSDNVNTSSGGLTQAENNALAPRDQAFADHVNAGGGLFGFSQTGLATPWYPYLDAIGSFTVASGGGSDITPTTEGTAVGVSDSLDVCCWHDDYVSFPSFLQPLAHYAGTTRIAAIGGQRVLVLRNCTAAEATASITRPAAGTFYLNNVASGSSGTSLPLVSGPTLTVNVAFTGGPMSGVDFEVDGTLVATDATAPFSTTIAVPAAPGIHTIRATAFPIELACMARSVVSFVVADPSVAAQGLGVGVAVDTLVDQVLTVGGVQVSGNGGSPSPFSLVDQSLTPVVDRATVVTDSADGSATATALVARGASKITGVSLLGGLIKADVVESRAEARYTASTNVLTVSDAGSRIAGLTVNNTSILDIPGQNMSIVIPGVGTLVVNEVVQTTAGRRGEITVNALHLYLNPGGAVAEVVVASAYAGVNYLEDSFDGPATGLISL